MYNIGLSKAFKEYCKTCWWVFVTEDDWISHEKDEPRINHVRGIDTLRRCFPPGGDIPHENWVIVFLTAYLTTYLSKMTLFFV